MPQIKEKDGWVIIHPDKYLELSEFNTKIFRDKYHKNEITAENWRKTFRPDCQLTRGNLKYIDFEVNNSLELPNNE